MLTAASNTAPEVPPLVLVQLEIESQPETIPVRLDLRMREGRWRIVRVRDIAQTLANSTAGSDGSAPSIGPAPMRQQRERPCSWEQGLSLDR